MNAIKLDLSNLGITPTVDNDIHIPRKKGSRWTLDILKSETFRVHGDKYDLSNINSEDVKSAGKILVVCKECEHRFQPLVYSFITKATGCPQCARIAPYTLESFIKKSREIHGDRFDYSEITKQHIKGHRSKVPIKCNLCGYKWDCILGNHANDYSRCPECSGKSKWTKETFIKKSIELHGYDKFDYSLIEDNNIIAKSKVTLKCKKMGHVFHQTVDKHVNARHGCPSCNHPPWSYERFICESKKIHQDLYDYNLINVNDIKISHSSIEIKCKRCTNIWITTVAIHIYSGHGCPTCNGHMPWNLFRLIKEGVKLHNDAFDYSLVGDENIKNTKSKFSIICNDCNMKTVTSINSHIYKQSGCKYCGCSSLEKNMHNYLKTIKDIQINIEHTFECINRRFDFYINHPDLDNPIIIECDGIQHFKRVGHFHYSGGYYQYRRQVDLYKIYLAILNRCYLIRLDYRVLEDIKLISQHLTVALDLFKKDIPYVQKCMYLSDTKLYDWVIDSFNNDTYPKVNPGWI